jgi:hypothetical protein
MLGFLKILRLVDFERVFESAIYENTVCTFALWWLHFCTLWIGFFGKLRLKQIDRIFEHTKKIFLFCTFAL